jgi:hypothetical protein
MSNQNKNFYDKYLKYKSKYESLKNQKGGFNMSDTSPNTIGALLKEYYEKYPQLTQILQNSQPNLDLNFMDSDDYMLIYYELYDLICKDEIYDQKFFNSSGIFHNKEGMHNYHIQLCALMTMSFLFELELFLVLHNYVGYNTSSNIKNTLPLVFHHRELPMDHHNQQRFYREIVSQNIEILLTRFMITLDHIFEKFMDDLVTRIATKTRQSVDTIYEKIVPMNHKYKKTKYDFIYVDWKDRIKSLEILSGLMPGPEWITKKDDSNGIEFYANIQTGQRTWIKPKYKGSYSTLINEAFEESMNNIEAGIGNKYIADGLGFFSFIFLQPNDTSPYFGSCITSSMVELYFAARLHVHSNNLILNMEKESDEITTHLIWTNIQKNRKISIPILSHWCTEYNFQSKSVVIRSMIGLNFINPSYKRYEHVGKASFTSNDKLRVCLLLLLPIFDSYLKYIEPLEAGPIKNYIQDFIYKRLNFVECLFNRNLIPQKIINIDGIKIDLSDIQKDLVRFSKRIFDTKKISDVNYYHFKSATEKMKIRSDKLNDQEIESIILFELAKRFDINNITGRSNYNNDIYYDGFFYNLINLISSPIPTENYFIDINDIDNNFYKLINHYKIHRV